MTAALTKSKVLVIDDFQGMRAMLREFLKSMGITNIDTAANGRDAMNFLRANQYDIVICDFNLGPGQNGQQVLDEARLFDHIGISTIWVMVTAEKTTDMVMVAAEARPDDYLLKPISQVLLETRLEKLIVRKHSLGGIEAAIKNKEYSNALALCDQQLLENTGNPQEIIRIKSDLLLTLGEHDVAKKLFETVLQKRSVPWAKTGLGRIRFQSGDFEGAAALFQEVLDENRMFIEASDWLVRCLLAMGQAVQAQSVLMAAVRLSPNSPTRQKTLGDTAYRNGEMDIAQTAFEKNISISEFSPYKSAGAFAGLARVLSVQGAPIEALKVIDQAKSVFKGNLEASIQTEAVEGAVYAKMGKPDKAQAALDKAEQLLRNLAGKANPEATLQLAESLLALGHKEKAFGLMRELVQNNHENILMSRQIEAICERSDLAEEGLALVKESRLEVSNINNQGVLLAKAGDFLGAVKLLRIAKETMPNNDVVTSNLCGLLLSLIGKEGKNDDLVNELTALLNQGRLLNPANKKYQAYASALANIVQTGS
jgi:tetratricopeptide (TPR) repeat protein